MATVHMGNLKKIIVYLVLMILLFPPNIKEETTISTNQKNTSATTQSPKSQNINLQQEHENSITDSPFQLKTNYSIHTQIEIRKIPTMNSTCQIFEVNRKYGIEIQKYGCQIIVDALDKHSEAMLKYLEVFCQRNENIENSGNSEHEKLYKCELEKKNGYKYKITFRDSRSNGNESINGLCENLTSIEPLGTNNNIITSYCVSLSESYIAYDDEKCCLGSFNLIPTDAFKTELLLIWIEGDGIAYIIGPLYILSFICICIIFLSGIVSRRYRSERGNQILIHFAFSIFIQFILHNLSCIINITPLCCEIHSIIFHYFILVESCWTSIIAYLQFKRFVKVFDNEPNHLILKLCAIAYIFPVVPISLWVIYHRQSTELSNYLTFGLPEFSILLINSTFLILITRNIVFVKNEYIEHRKSLTMEVKLIFFLFFVLDFSWFDIILADLTAFKFFIYLFLLTQSMQGFMMFFVFGIMNDHNRFIYKKFLTVYTKKVLRIR